MPSLARHQSIAELIQSSLKVGEQIRFSVTSNSMVPILGIGEYVIAETTPTNLIHSGDILVIKRENDFLTHRAISHSKNGWLTKGDNNTLPDRPIPANQIIGRVIAVEKANRTIELREQQWINIGTLLAKFGKIETKAFLIHRYFRYPFRFAIKFLQKTLIMRMIT